MREDSLLKRELILFFGKRLVVRIEVWRPETEIGRPETEVGGPETEVGSPDL